MIREIRAVYMGGLYLIFEAEDMQILARYVTTLKLRFGFEGY
jgi:hypothetical protein